MAADAKRIQSALDGVDSAAVETNRVGGRSDFERRWKPLHQRLHDRSVRRSRHHIGSPPGNHHWNQNYREYSALQRLLRLWRAVRRLHSEQRIAGVKAHILRKGSCSYWKLSDAGNAQLMHYRECTH